ncbi:MAG: hypothetical protein QG597_1231 [Actinomycetota bacterium]|nr:hypothetical protein [Actinomycetota bacterium]
MNGFIAQEHWRGQYLTVTRQNADAVAIAVSGPRGAHKSYVELDAEQARQLGSFLTPTGDIAAVVRELARAMHRYEATDEADLVGEDTCWEAAALRDAANRLIALVDPAQRDAWRAEDAAQWRTDYPNYAAKAKVPA